jgi:hypothetical protein
MTKPWLTVRLRLLRPAERGESANAAKEYRLLGVRLDGQGPLLDNLPLAPALKRRQAGTAVELNALLPAIIDSVFKGEL